MENSLSVNKANFVAYKKGKITGEYSVSESIGSGSFGTVRKAVHKKTGQARAIKILKKSEQDENRLFLEVEILSRLCHPNIMQINEFYDDNKYFYIVSELCQGGELFDKIISKGSFSERDAAMVMKQLLSSIMYCHANNIVHRDLKPENILLDDKSDNPIVKIIDWGGARYFTKNKKMTKISGTPYYIAPEVLNEVYDQKCDIWSCGVIMYILLCGYPPFNGNNDVEIMKAVKKGKYEFPPEEWNNISKTAKTLISNMLKYNPKQRFSPEECLNDTWFKMLDNKELDNSQKNISLNVIKNMKRFKAGKKLEHAAVSYIVNQIISKEEKNELLKQFQQWDKNSDGQLSKDEILEGCKLLYGELKAEAEATEIFKSVDLDGNGFIDYNEFLTASINRNKILNKQSLQYAFKSFDKDGSGKLSIEEVVYLFSQAGNLKEKDKKEIEQMLKDVDKNGDGEIEFKEFCAMMESFFS